VLDRDLANQVLTDILDRPAGEWEAALEVACARNPELAPQLRKRFAALCRTGLTAPSPFPERIGDYRLHDCLGSGGMGAVFSAEQLPLGRKVAVKVIRPDGRFFGEHVERFRREIQALARLQHPHIVRIIDGGEQEQVPYYAMEFVEGCTLHEALRRIRESGRAPESLSGADLAAAVGAGPPAFPRGWVATCVSVVQPLAEALQHAHETGIVHRDVKPSNVMLGKSGQVLLIDFGLARTDTERGLTATQANLGALPYLAPEVVLNGSRVASAGSDVYGLGATLYEMLTLHPAFVGEAAVLASRIVRGDLAAPRAVNRAISVDANAVCMKALEVDPRRRYASAKALASDLQALLDSATVTARAPGVFEEARRLARRKPWQVALAASLTLVLMLAGTVWSFHRMLARSSEREETGALASRLHELWNLGAKYIRGNRAADYAAWSEDYAHAFTEHGFPLGTKAQQVAFAERWRTLAGEGNAAAKALLRGLQDFEQRLARAGCHVAAALESGERLPLPSKWSQSLQEQFREGASRLRRERSDLVALWPAVPQLIEQLQADPQMRAVHAAWLRWKLHADPSGLAQLASSAELGGGAATWLGEACVEALGPEAAIPVLKIAVALNKGDFRANFVLGLCLRSIARKSNSLTQLEESILHYEIATAIDPDSPWAWTNLGEAVVGLGELDPSGLAPAERAALEHAELDRMERAKRAYRMAIKLSDQSAAAFANLANCLPRDDPQRLDLLERALRIAPDDVGVLRSAATLAAEQKATELQLQYERRAVAAAPNDVAGICDLASALLQSACEKLPSREQRSTTPDARSSLQEALANLERARVLDSQEPSVCEMQFACRAQLGDDEPAMDDLECGLRLHRSRLSGARPIANRRLAASHLGSVKFVMDTLEPTVAPPSRARWQRLCAEVKELWAQYER
jgi:serine/threonine protein kinase